MQNAALAAQTYRRTAIQSRSPLELVTMLYECATRSLEQAHSAIERDDGAAKRDAIARALGVVVELQNVLNLEDGGEIATSLDGLYSFVIQRLIDANHGDNIEAIDEATRVMVPLQDAWAELARSQAAGENR